MRVCRRQNMDFGEFTIQRLSGKSQWTSIWSIASSQNRAKMSHLALLKQETQAIKNPAAIFQAVSPRTWLN